MESVTDLNIPDLGDSDEMELLIWHKKKGETFLQGDELADLVSDKAAFSLEAPGNGEILDIYIDAPSKVQPGQRALQIRLKSA